MRRVLYFYGLFIVLACLVGCNSIYEKFIIYYVPKWDMFIKLTNSERGEHRLYFSHNKLDLKKQKNTALDYVVMDNDYLYGLWHFLIVNQASPDTLFVMSKKYNSVTVPMKTITSRSFSHFRIDGAYYKCEEGYFGFYIYKGRCGVQLNELSEKEDDGWELREVCRNCLRL